jgi:glutathione synthase/RimK-type ligase-like ATP-grasp enzyme
VDIKRRGRTNFVMEVNDNPNVDHGFEDSVLGDGLYLDIMQGLWNRVAQPKRARR